MCEKILLLFEDYIKNKPSNESTHYNFPITTENIEQLKICINDANANANIKLKKKNNHIDERIVNSMKFKMQNDSRVDFDDYRHSEYNVRSLYKRAINEYREDMRNLRR